MQENNAIAKINLISKSVTALFPLGFKDYNLDLNAIALKKWPAFGIYEPDAISVFEAGGVPYLYTANEGDAREYTGFTETRRVSSNATVLDPIIFPNAATLKLPAQMGRLNHTITLGNTDADPDFEAIYSLGARSFSVWNGNDGSLIFDSKNDLEQRCITAGCMTTAAAMIKEWSPKALLWVR